MISRVCVIIKSRKIKTGVFGVRRKFCIGKSLLGIPVGTSNLMNMICIYCILVVVIPVQSILYYNMIIDYGNVSVLYYNICRSSNTILYCILIIVYLQL